jgi:hypothetical protein
LKQIYNKTIFGWQRAKFFGIDMKG